MQTLETLKRSIESTEELGSVVSTMKSLSAVHIRQYERSVEGLRRYARTIELGLQVVLQSRLLPQRPPRQEPPKRTALFVFGSDYGLCGQFNDEVVEHALGRLDDLGLQPDERVVAAVGGRVGAALRGRGPSPQREFVAPSSVGAIERGVRDLLLTIDAWREEERVGRVLLAYHEHRSSSELRLRTTQLLPVELARFRDVAESRWPSRRLPIFTMDAERLLSALLRQFFSVALFRAFAESAASEHASRLQSMQAAERNIEEKLEEQNAEFRRRRQDAITAELIDIVSGYEALSGRDAT